jgi:hypothetical protein
MGNPIASEKIIFLKKIIFSLAIFKKKIYFCKPILGIKTNCQIIIGFNKILVNFFQDDTIFIDNIFPLILIKKCYSFNEI